MEKKKLEDVKKLLVVVDMINGFVREGAMACHDVEDIVQEVERLVKDFTESSDKQVAFVKDTHDPDCSEFKKYPAHCIKGTREAENIDELKKYEHLALVHEKNSTSAIFPGGLLKKIDEMKNLKEVVVVGCLTDYCVLDLAKPLQCYFDQFNRDVEVVVPENAVKTFDAPNHNAEEWTDIAFEIMERSGIKKVKRYEGK